MKQLVVYLTFAGNCREALEFYRSCFGGEFNAQEMGDSPSRPEGAEPHHIMHADFKSDGIYFMASDGLPPHSARPGNMISLSIDVKSEAEQTEIFNRLSAGGEVTMELQDTFWGARFGMVTDRFGISWMLNYDKPTA